MSTLPDPDPTTRRFWTRLIAPLLRRNTTPFYLFSSEPVAQAVQELARAFKDLPVTHWLSVKTQPLPPLLSWWHRQGRPLEVVSELEFLAATRVGATGDSVLVNGPAKHRWLRRYPVPRLNVNFDSVAEVLQLAPLAKRCRWRCGLRLLTASEFDPEMRAHPTQFGMSAQEAAVGIRHLRLHGIEPHIAHLHLRTNVSDAGTYEKAAKQISSMCSALRWRPEILDLGGGFPAPRVHAPRGPRSDASFILKEMATVYRNALRQFSPNTRLWLENGRWLSARSGALVVRIVDVKERRGLRSLICDGGRTMNALVSMWEQHTMFSLPSRSGAKAMTTVNGPTCMAFDKLAHRSLPRRLQANDHLVWLEAGAYHLSWETRFSHGLAAVFWHDGTSTKMVRRGESFDDWWSQWR